MLKVYRASAGSGKTYRLTYEYIKMLLGRRNEHDQYYTFYRNYNNSHRRILAVTFTNKATEEMKQRIVSQLDVLAHTPNESDYIDDLCNAFRCDESCVQRNAAMVLHQILQDFSFFGISTIDSFFQQVLRAFTREVGLQGGYDVELDTSYVTMAAIDRMFDSLDNNKELFDWILEYAREQIRNGKSWNIHNRSDLPLLAKQLSSEVFKRYSKVLHKVKLSDYNHYINTLRNFREQYVTRLADAARQAREAISQQGITYDVFYRGWIKKLDVVCDEQLILADIKAFQKIAETWRNKMEDPEGWFTSSKLKKGPSIPHLIEALSPAFYALNDMLGEQLIEFNSVDVCLRHIYAMGVLTTIGEYVNEYSQEHNSILLSETPDILRGLINKSDAPFIYEKMGTRISHYMIDEFQDTSNLQWDNFEPLVNESLAGNNENLIVGDVKQSIYRWRNSDWRLLHKGLDDFNYASMTSGNDTNWRSCAGVIAFNNSFFKVASVLLQGRIRTLMQAGHHTLPDDDVIGKIYENVSQKVSEKKLLHSGRVDLHILKSRNSEIFEDEILQRLPAQLEELLIRGYRPKDILILVRKGKEGCKVVELLLSLAAEHTGVLRDIKVISDDSLLLSSAPPVKLIIGILRYIQNPGYDLNKLILAYEHGLVSGNDSNRSLTDFFERKSTEKTIDEDLDAFIRDISSKSLFEMCELIIHHFKLNTRPEYIAYIEAFQDVVVEYCSNRSSDVYSFLRWWDDKEGKYTVKSPENLNAITVLTIHKSKGLEYPVVIIPFAHWTMSSASSNQPNMMWYEPDRPPFNHLPVLPIDHKDELVSTIFAPQYFQELISEYVDNLNLAYVAFTRARQELIIYTRTPSKRGAYMLGDVISETLNFPEPFDEVCPTIDFASCIIEDSDEEKILSIGADWTPLIEDKPATEMTSVAYDIVIPSQKRLKQRTTAAGVSGNAMRNKGILMHEILSLIYTVQDVDKVVQQFVREGKLMKRQACNIAQELTSLITTPEVQHWFSTDVQVLNETDIIISDTSVSRPDRIVIDGDRVVVIDYKFGNIEKKSYCTQVSRYMNYLRLMGYEHVDGYIWYVTKSKLLPVD